MQEALEPIPPQDTQSPDSEVLEDQKDILEEAMDEVITEQKFIRDHLRQKYYKQMLLFTQNTSTFFNVEESLENLGIPLENLTEAQIEFFIKRSSLSKAPFDIIYQNLASLQIQDFMILNLKADDLEQFITVLGAFFYSRTVMRMISKKNIITIKEIIGDEIYKHTINFGKNECKDDYPIQPPFKEKFYRTGYHIFQIYFSQLPKILQDLAMMEKEHLIPEDKNFLIKIDYDYSQHIIQTVQSLMLDIS